MLKQITLACLACGLTLSGLDAARFGPAPAAAQSQDEQHLVEAQDMISWMKEAAEIGLSTSMVLQTETLIDMINVMAEDSLDVNELEELLIRFKQEKSAYLAEATQLYTALERPEKWDIGGWSANSMERKLYAVTVDLYEGVPQTIKITEDVADNFVDLIQFVIDGHGEFDVDAFSAETAAVTLEALKTENKLVRGMANALPKSSPNYWLHLVMMDLNTSMMAETGILTIVDNGDTDQLMAARQEAGRDMLAAISGTPALLKKGRDTIPKSVKSLDSYLEKTLSPQERSFITAARDVTLSFSNALDIEHRLYELQHRNGELYASDLSDTQIDPEILDNDAEYMMLQTERQTQMIQRMAMIEQSRQ